MCPALSNSTPTARLIHYQHYQYYFSNTWYYFKSFQQPGGFPVLPLLLGVWTDIWSGSSSRRVSAPSGKWLSRDPFHFFPSVSMKVLGPSRFWRETGSVTSDLPLGTWSGLLTLTWSPVLITSSFAPLRISVYVFYFVCFSLTMSLTCENLSLFSPTVKMYIFVLILWLCSISDGLIEE